MHTHTHIHTHTWYPYYIIHMHLICCQLAIVFLLAHHPPLIICLPCDHLQTSFSQQFASTLITRDPHAYKYCYCLASGSISRTTGLENFLIINIPSFTYIYLSLHTHTLHAIPHTDTTVYSNSLSRSTQYSCYS